MQKETTIRSTIAYQDRVSAAVYNIGGAGYMGKQRAEYEWFCGCKDCGHNRPSDYRFDWGIGVVGLKIRREAGDDEISTCRAHSWLAYYVASIGFYVAGVLGRAELKINVIL